MTKFYPIFFYSGFHVILMPVLSCLYCISSRKLKLEKETLLMACFVGYMITRVLFSAIDENMTRVIAAAYNIFVLLSGVFLYQALVKLEKFRIEIINGFSFLFVFTIVSYQIIYGYSIFTHSYELEHPSLLGILAGNSSLPGILESAKTVIYTRLEWGFGDVIPRLVFLAEFPTTAALVLLVSYQFYLLNKGYRLPVIKLLLIDSLVLVTSLYTQSRVMTLAFILSTLMFYLIYFRRYKIIGGLLKIFTPFVMFLMIFGLFELASFLSGFRGASEDARFTSYITGINMVLDNNLAFGLGIKPDSPAGLDIPIGSHSSFISIFVKYGLVGLFFLITLLVIMPIINGYYLLKRNLLDSPQIYFFIRTIPIIILWILFQDIDAYVIACTLVFTCLAIYRSYSRV